MEVVMKANKFYEFDYNPKNSINTIGKSKHSPDFTKLKIEYTSEIQNGWGGDWDSVNNIIKIHKGLNDVDKHGVIIHEFIEMMVTSLMGIPGFPNPEYDQNIHGERNQLAHDFANEVEKRVMEMSGINWDEHEKRVDQIRGVKAE